MNPPAPTDRPDVIGKLLSAAAVAVPMSLLWDFSWESTVGVDQVWGPPHVATYAAVALAALAAIALVWRNPRREIGAWVVLWGALAFVTAFVFDRWWQAGYGLAAGIWHPPQLVKAVAFFAIVCGAWWRPSPRSAGPVLAMIAVVTLAANFANLQHGAAFFQIACATYPVVLVATAVAGGGRFPAARAALVCMALQAALVWLLPLVKGSPEGGPVYHPRTTLLPPPFPLLLVAPALALDCMMRARRSGWLAAAEGGLAFFVVFAAVQWPFASFLLTPAADHWFFAGGGRHWPFFMPLTAEMHTSFWPDTLFDLKNSAVALALACASARLGLWLGAWLPRMGNHEWTRRGTNEER